MLIFMEFLVLVIDWNFSLSDYLGFESVFKNSTLELCMLEFLACQFKYIYVATFLRVESSVSCQLSIGLWIAYAAAKFSAYCLTSVIHLDLRLVLWVCG